LSKGCIPNGVFVDTGLLRDHVSKLQNERKMAERLRENLMAMQNSSDPETVVQYRSVLNDVDQLCAYFTRMARLLDNVGDEAVTLSRKIATLIEKDAEQTRHASSRLFML